MMEPAHILELRIHGVANAPPAETLCTTTERVVREDGDDQGSFWRIRSTSAAGDDPGDPGEPGDPTGPQTAATGRTGGPPEPVLETEAYSWGNQARSGGSALVLIGRAFVHVAWLLVLPFGLCNLAYWGRRDIKGAEEHEKIWDGGAGALMIRVFGVLQTLFYAAGMLAVSVNLVALQCFPAPDRTCAVLPAWMAGLGEWSPIARSALLGLAPVAVVLLIYVVGSRARGSFNPDRSFDDEPLTSRERSGEDDRIGPPRPPLLATSAFWQRTRSAQLSERTHLAAVLAFVLVILAADARMETTAGSSPPGSPPLERLFGPTPATLDDAVPLVATIGGGVLLLAAFVLAALGGLSGRYVGNRVKRAFATALLIVSASAYAAWTLWAILVHRGDARRSGDEVLAGMLVVPTALAAIGALIALASLSWGFRRRYRIISGILIIGALTSVVAAELRSDEGDELRMDLSFIALVGVALAVAVSYSPLLFDREERERSRELGWHGNAAAVMLLTAWFSSLVLTSLLVLGVHAWLTADTGASKVAGMWRVEGNAEYADEIARPAFYDRFAGMLVVILVILVIVIGIALATSQRRLAAFSLPELRFPSDVTATQRAREAGLGGARMLLDDRTADAADAARRTLGPEPRDWWGERVPFDPRVVPRRDYPRREQKAAGRLRAVADARRVAALAHRGEPVLTLLAMLTAASLVFLGIPFLGGLLDGTHADAVPDTDPMKPLWEAVRDAWAGLSALSGWAVGLVALGSAAWVVTNALTSSERPLGIIWDIVCFFPRAGHPFAPPCYAERAVPEVKKRIMRHLDRAGTDGGTPGVVISAHSMGATIAVAAIFALAEEDAHGVRRPGSSARTERLALLTHGIQLRAYFSRFFPEVFGWRVLGIRGTRGPSLFRSDPWSPQVIAEDSAPFRSADDGPPTVVSLLGGDLRDPAAYVPPRWRSLWRRTDYLGFPAFSYWSRTEGAVGNPIDRGATERSPRSYLWAVARHNDYLSTTEYRAARSELVGMLAQHPPGDA
ncbi:hypothetical protein [Agromyces tropicus]